MKTSKASSASTIPAGAAKTVLWGGSIFVLLVFLLHFIKSDFDPSWRFVSEYAIGEQSWIMRVAFFTLSLTCLAAVATLKSQVTTRGGKIGLGILTAVGVALIGAGLFAQDPVTATKDEATTHGALHAFFTAIGIPGVPIAALLITRSLTRFNKAWAPAKSALRITAHLTWITLAGMMITLFVTLGQNDGKFGPDVPIGWPNRIVLAAYVVWLMTAACYALKLRKK